MYDDAQDALAAEYVLGTLSADERSHAETLLSIDPGFAESVRQWERRLGELNVMVEAVEPPPAVWDKIRAGLGDAALPSEFPLAMTEAAVPPPPETATAATPETPAPAAPETVLEESGPLSPSAEPLSEAASDSIAASLAASLAELAPDHAPPPPEPKVERSGNVVQLSRRVDHWRRLTMVAGALAAVLALYIALGQFAPGLIPFGPHTQMTAQSQGPAQPGARLVAVLQQDPTAPAFLLTVDPQSRTLTVRRVSATPEPGRSYELWLVSSKFPTPRSLGIVGTDEFTQRAIPGTFDVDTVRTASYAVSLEPAGGSPTGVPTGPVLFTGRIVQSVPPAQAPRT